MQLHRDLDSIPVLARAGTVLPMVPADDVARGHRPAAPWWRYGSTPVPPAAFVLVEDRDDQRWARTRLTWANDGSEEVRVHAVEGDAATLPAGRTYRTRLCMDLSSHSARAFVLLDRAQVDFELKEAAYDVVRHADSPGAAVLGLQGLDLAPGLLSALSEILLAGR